jgi:hypothetical protein
MKRIIKILCQVVIGSSLLFVGIGPLAADGIPLTIDGVINCAHPDNAITTTCRGIAPPAAVNTPPVPVITPPATPVTPTATSPSEPVAPAVPMTNPDGSLNCAQPDNAITTTCWERAQADKKSGASAVPTGVDCAAEKFKNYPVCTGIAPQAVVDLEKSKSTSTPLPEAVNCADPMLAQTSACTNRTTTDLPADCALSGNSNLPRCQPMTLADGSINCAQPDNAVTTTCWEQAIVMKSFGATTAIDCRMPGYQFYPACTGIKPQAVINFEKTNNVIKANQETSTPMAESTTATVIETATAQNAPKEVKISGSVDLKSRSTKATVLQIDLDLAKAKVKVIATKKGSPTLTQNVSADVNGNKTVTFKQNLKGYTVKIVVDGATIDSVKI